MRLFDLTVPLVARAYCHGPADRAFDVAALISAGGNDRWNERGEPTLYLAGDLGVALVEFGRHLETAAEAVSAREDAAETARTIWAVDVGLSRVADLRDPTIRSLLNLRDDPGWLLDRRRCRELGSAARATGDVEALIVPSAGFADRPERSNVVVFADCLANPLEETIAGARAVGSVHLETDGPPSAGDKG
jgi:RES domain-containing protein